MYIVRRDWLLLYKCKVAVQDNGIIDVDSKAHQVTIRRALYTMHDA